MVDTFYTDLYDAIHLLHNKLKNLNCIFILYE